MDFKKINIVTINLNNGAFLERTIKSVIEQTFFDKINYIVIDGGSTDGSIEIFEKYREYFDYYVSENDNGIYNAMNKGVAACNGEYVLFINSGDYLHDKYVIETIYEKLDTDIVYGAVNVHNGENTYILNDDYMKYMSMTHPSCFTKVELLRKNKFKEDYGIISDWIFFYEEIFLKKTPSKKINDIISDFFTGGVSSSVENCTKEKKRYFDTLKNIKIALCCIGRLENKYAVEFVEFYNDLGVDKFFIYDNNHDGEEHFEEVLQPYIDKGIVEIVNYRNKSFCQVKSYQDCYNKHGNEYDWICFFDFDEYLLLEHANTLKELLSLDIYKEYEIIHVNELIYGDSGNVKYENRPLVDRFITPVMPIDFKKTFDFSENCQVKSIIRGGLKSVVWDDTPRTPTNRLKGCDASGKSCQSDSHFVIPYVYTNVCLRHYKTKSLEEYYLTKVKKGYQDGDKNFFKKNNWIDEYFSENKITPEKISFINNVLLKGFDSFTIKNNEIAVIIPCYNQGKYIKETIKSLQDSTYYNFSCIIVNDGSTDNSEEEILNAIKDDKRFDYIKTLNKGVGHARNLGIKLTESKYILCLDSDDKISPTYIEKAIKFLNEHNEFSIYYGEAKLFYDNGDEFEWNLPPFNHKALLKGRNMIYSSHIFRRSDFNKTDGYDEYLGGYEDWEFLIRLLDVCGEVHKTNETVFFYRNHEDSRNHVANKKAKKLFSYIFKKNKKIYEKIIYE